MREIFGLKPGAESDLNAERIRFLQSLFYGSARRFFCLSRTFFRPKKLRVIVSREARGDPRPWGGLTVVLSFCGRKLQLSLHTHCPLHLPLHSMQLQRPMQLHTATAQSNAAAHAHALAITMASVIYTARCNYNCNARTHLPNVACG